MQRQHQEWIEDLIIRLLCVFALDRFGDFVSDEVSAEYPHDDDDDDDLCL